MKCDPIKTCDLCGERVAEKPGLFWHTVKDYVTVREDDEPGYVYQEQNTIVVKNHYCIPCWLRIKNAARKLKGEN